MSLPACRRVVVGSDLSRGSDAAVRLGIAWAAQHDAEALVLHAASGLTASARAEVEDALRAQALESGSDEMRVRTSVAVAEGPAAEALRAAVTRPGDWLCVGCEGASATVLRQPGRIAVALVGASEAPLLLAPRGWSAPPRRRHRVPAGSGLPARKRSSATFGRVLVGVPGTARDRALVAAGIAQAQATGGTLSLAHVLDVSASRFHPASARAALRERTDQAILAERERLADLANDLSPMDLTARSEAQAHVVAQGPPERDLAGLGRSQSIELMMVGAGPVAARLVAFAGCPILVLP